jgi:hypothetical protein
VFRSRSIATHTKYGLQIVVTPPDLVALSALDVRQTSVCRRRDEGQFRAVEMIDKLKFVAQKQKAAAR